MDGGYNISSDSSCGFSAAGSLNGVDPRLGPLDDYGGLTPTVPLLVGSPAIDHAGNPGPATDQRGIARPFGTAVDSGAFESAPPYSIRGRITGHHLGPGITVSAGVVSVISDGTGKYTLSGLAPDSYTVNASAMGLVVVPASVSVMLGPDVADLNFRAYRLDHLAIEAISNNEMRVVYAGATGETHRVQFSSNLLTWSDAFTNTVGANGIFEVFHTNTSSAGARLFRSVKP